MAQRIAVIPGDGIGKEVMPEGLRALDAAARRHGLDFKYEHHDFASCDYYLKHGAMLPPDWKDRLQGVDAIFYGAVGWPATVPDHVSLWGSLLKFRREFDQYVNLRPCRLMPGIASPLVDRAGKARPPGDNRHDDRAREHRGRILVDRRPHVRRHRARGRDPGNGDDADRRRSRAEVRLRARVKRPKRHLTSATKSNGISITMPFWDERVEAMAAHFPEVTVDKFHIDILTAHFVQRPEFFDVVVASNLFGDILSDLGPACTGTIGIAPSANLNPERSLPVAVRTGAWLGAGHCGQGHREPDRPDLECIDDARLARPW